MDEQSQMGQRIDDMIEAIQNDELERAAELVQAVTGVSGAQAMKVVLTLAEGLEEVEGTGVDF